MCAGSELMDTQGETLSVEGADISELEKLQKDLLDRTLAALAEAKQTIEQILSAKKESTKGRRKRMVKAGKVQAGAPRKEELVHAKDKAKNVVEVALSMDMAMDKSVQTLIEYVDQEILIQKLTETEYSEFLDDLSAFLEETL